MAESPFDPSAKPPKPPPLPPGLGQKPLPAPPLGAIPKIASLPPKPPALTKLQPPAPLEPVPDKPEYEKKVAELEKRLQEEREKVLLANLKTQTESANAAKVEVSIRELQERLRRDRLEQDREEVRLKLEAKVQELETRLLQERETWVATLKNQMQTRETQDHELENHFTSRLSEMERRWLEEKALWQKSSLAKDEELRNFRALTEKLKGIEGELARVSTDKQALETRVVNSARDLAEADGRLKTVGEKERENMDLKMRLASLQDKYERELGALRMSGREREERLALDCDRLQKDLATLSKRLAAEHEVEMLRLKIESEQESREFKEALLRAQSQEARLKAICGAQEKQTSVLRAGLEKAKAGLAQDLRAEKERMIQDFDKARAEALALQESESKNLRSKLGQMIDEQRASEEQIRKLRGALEEAHEKAVPLKARIQEISLEKSILERQTMSRSAELKEAQDSLGRLRAEISRHERRFEHAQQEKERLERQLQAKP